MSRMLHQIELWGNVKVVWNQSYHSRLNKDQEHSLLYYLPIDEVKKGWHERNKNTKKVKQKHKEIETQTTSYKIWTLIIDSISYDDNGYEIYIWGLSTLVKEFSAAARIMQSSSNELSTLVSSKV